MTDIRKEFNPVMTTEELGEYLQVGRTAIIKYIRKENLPHTLLSNRYRFMKVLVDEWLKQRMIQKSPNYIQHI